MKAGSSGDTSFARAARASSVTVAAAILASCQPMAPMWGDGATTITERSLGKRSSDTTVPVSGNETTSLTIWR